MRQWRVGTLTMGILLVALGVVMIVARVNGISAIEHIINWWPVILVMLGLEILVFSLLPNQDQTRIKFDGFSIFMVIMIVIISVGTYGVTSLIRNISNFDIFHDAVQHSKYQTTFNKSISVNAKGKDKVIINNSFGKVQVAKGTGDNIEIQANIVIHNNDEQYAKEISDSLIDISESGDISIASKREEYMNDRARVQNISVNYSIKVPENLSVEIENKFGSVNVENTGRSVKVQNSHGDVTAKQIGGDLYVNNSFASIYVEGVNGKADIYDRNSSVTVRKVEGNLTLENSFGSVKVEEVKCDSKILNNNGRIEADKIDGNLIVDSKFCQIDINGVKGNLEVKGNNGSMVLDTVEGDVKADNKFGSIELANANKYVELKTKNGSINYKSNKIIEKGVQLENEYGNIVLEVPKDQQGQFKASTRYGKIHHDFPLSVNKEANSESIDIKIGDSSVNFDLNNKNGDIRIMKR